MTRSPRAAALLTGLLTLALVPALITPAQARSSGPARTAEPANKVRAASSAPPAGQARASAAPRAGVTPAATGSDPYDWPTYGRTNQRESVAHNMLQIHTPIKQNWDVKLDGGVYGSPVVADGIRIVATQNNSVYAILGNKAVWHRSIGPSVPRSALPCGSIDPNGIISTPAYDPVTKTLVVVGLVNNPIRHVAVGLNPHTGAVLWTRSADVPSNIPGIDPKAMQQRGALIVTARRLYIAYGGLAGDCSAHRGAVIGINLDRPGDGVWTFVVPASRIGGIWAPGGPTERPGGGGLYVTVANGPTFQTGAYDYTNAVLRIASQRIVDSYSPTTWRTDNQQDIGLGSQSPTLIGNYVFIAGKTGTAYVLRRDSLGGIGGEVSQMNLCKSFGGTAVVRDVVFVPCTDGIRAVRITSTGTMQVLWHAASGVTGSPVLGAGRVFSMDPGAGVLRTLNPATGAVIENLPVGPTAPWVKPTLWRSAVLIGTTTGIKSFNWT